MITVIVVIVVVAALLVLGTVAARKSGYPGVGGNTIVRCRKGHLFTTIWAPGLSFKAVRLGLSRYQWCPVGRHFTLVTPVKDSELTDEQRHQAAERHDVRIP